MPKPRRYEQAVLMTRLRFSSLRLTRFINSSHMLCMRNFPGSYTARLLAVSIPSGTRANRL